MLMSMQENCVSPHVPSLASSWLVERSPSLLCQGVYTTPSVLYKCVGHTHLLVGPRWGCRSPRLKLVVFHWKLTQKKHSQWSDCFSVGPIHSRLISNVFCTVLLCKECTCGIFICMCRINSCMDLYFQTECLLSQEERLVGWRLSGPMSTGLTFSHPSKGSTQLLAEVFLWDPGTVEYGLMGFAYWFQMTRNLLVPFLFMLQVHGKLLYITVFWNMLHHVHKSGFWAVSGSNLCAGFTSWTAQKPAWILALKVQVDIQTLSCVL